MIKQAALRISVSISVGFDEYGFSSTAGGLNPLQSLVLVFLEFTGLCLAAEFALRRPLSRWLLRLRYVGRNAG
jgi:hypothetical protein